MTHEKSLGFTVRIEVARVRKPCGSPFPTSIIKTPAFILTFDRLITAFFQQTIIRQWVNKRGKPIISNALTVPSDKACLDGLEKHGRFPKNLNIIVEQSGILFITVMPIFVTNSIALNHSVFMTTQDFTKNSFAVNSDNYLDMIEIGEYTVRRTAEKFCGR